MKRLTSCTLLICCFITSGCAERIPEESYQWNSRLAETKGHLGPFLKDLDLGDLSYFEDDHPQAKDPHKGKLVLTNARDLVEFINWPSSTEKEQAHSSALALYTDENAKVSGVVSVILRERPVKLSDVEKGKKTFSMPGIALSGSTASLKFYLRPLKGFPKMKARKEKCQFYEADGQVNQISGAFAASSNRPNKGLLSYTVLTAFHRNLQLEIAVRGSLPRSKKYLKELSKIDRHERNNWKYDEDTPAPSIEILPDPLNETLTRLNLTYRKVGLKICPQLETVFPDDSA